MPVSIEELDATVRAFYEGRGEQVNIHTDDLLKLFSCSKNRDADHSCH